MKKYLMSLLIIGMLLFLFGCSSETNNAKIPKEGRMMKDSAGNEYLVEHHMGRAYTVKPIPRD